MKELSLNILDIAGNSVRAEATLIEILLEETEETLSFTIKDDGRGMTRELLARVTDPFATTRTTRKVGLGIPFLKMEAEQTGGYLTIESRSIEEFPDAHGTVLSSRFVKTHIDYIPLGDIVETVCTLVHGMGKIDLLFRHSYLDREVTLSTADMREMLGDELPLSSPDVIEWLRAYLSEGYAELYGN